MRRLFVVAAAWLVAVPAHAAALAIVMAVDVSGSVTPDSYILQRDGIARAFKDPRLVDMIAAMPGGIEALVLEWSDPDKMTVTVGWTHISDAGSAARFAAEVHATTRSSRGLTAIGPALAAAAAQFDRLPQSAARRIVDISGDGIANIGEPPSAVRDRLVKAGVTINALAILTEEPWLGDYDRRNVIGGPGAFVLAVRDFHSFADAMLRKLAAEVAGGAAPSTARTAGFAGSTGARPLQKTVRIADDNSGIASSRSLSSGRRSRTRGLLAMTATQSAIASAAKQSRWASRPKPDISLSSRATAVGD